MALQRELRLVEEVKRHSVASSYASSIASWDGESDLGGSDNEFAAPASAAQDGKHVIPEDKERDRRGKATFHLKPWHEQNWFERLLTTGVADDVVYRRKAQRREGMPEHSPWRENVWILPRALFAPALQQLSYWVWPGQSSLALFERRSETDFCLKSGNGLSGSHTPSTSSHSLPS